MKGLIRNNFYSIAGTLKLTIFFSMIAMIIVSIVVAFSPFSNNYVLLVPLIGGILGGIGALSGTSLQKDSTTKWNKFELTMPISRNDVITARYISFALYIFIGIFLAMLGSLLFYLVTGSLNLERMFYGFSFGIAFAISIPTFMIPLVLIFGSDKNDALLMVSIALGLALFFGSSAIAPLLFKDSSNINFVFRFGYFIFSILLYLLSYFVSLCLYKKKEL